MLTLDEMIRALKYEIANRSEKWGADIRHVEAMLVRLEQLKIDQIRDEILERANGR